MVDFLSRSRFLLLNVAKENAGMKLRTPVEKTSLRLDYETAASSEIAPMGSRAWAMMT